MAINGWIIKDKIKIYEKRLADNLLGKLHEMEKMFQTNHNVDVNVFSEDGATPLIYACLNNHVNVVKLLLKKGAQPDIQDKLNGWTALMHATVKR